MTIAYTSMPVWPHGATDERRNATFKVDYNRTIRDLEYEVDLLRRRDQDLVITIGAGYRPGDIRLDGRPRADARAPLHPGVEISFDTRYGRLTYATDVFWDWRDNVRAIALGLGALRDVDRWGVAKRGQQYAGFAQITSGGPDPARGGKLVERAGGYRAAIKQHHPDAGGEERDIVDINAWKDQQPGDSAY